MLIGQAIVSCVLRLLYAELIYFLVLLWVTLISEGNCLNVFTSEPGLNLFDSSMFFMIHC